MTKRPTWEVVTVKLSELKPWANNPRYSTKAQAQRILDSIAKFGQAKPVNIGPRNEVYDGHQRLSALLTMYGGDYEVVAFKFSRELTEAERRQFTVYINSTAVGSMDWNAIANGWEKPETLSEWGLDDETLRGWRTDASALSALVDSEREPTDVEAEWEGMPELGGGAGALKSILVHFESEQDLQAFSELVGQEITENTKSIWYPKKERRDLKDVRFVQE